MSSTRFDVGRHWTEPTVEPQRRMVGGRFGWASHRFPIKGGISRMRAHQISVTEAVMREVTKQSFLGVLLRNSGHNSPIQASTEVQS